MLGGQKRAFQTLISQSVQTNAFADGVVSKYENLIPALQTAHEAEGFRLNYNKAVMLAKFLKNKRMIEQVGSDYTFLTDYHY